MHNVEKKKRDELADAICYNTTCRVDKCPGFSSRGGCSIIGSSIEDIIKLLDKVDPTWVKHRMKDPVRFAIVMDYTNGTIILE